MSGSQGSKNIIDKAGEAVVYLYRLFHYATTSRPTIKQEPTDTSTSKRPAPTYVEPKEDGPQTVEPPTRHERRRTEIKKRMSKDIRKSREKIRELREERGDLGQYSREIDSLLRQEEEDLRAGEHELVNLDLKD